MSADHGDSLDMGHGHGHGHGFGHGHGISDGIDFDIDLNDGSDPLDSDGPEGFDNEGNDDVPDLPRATHFDREAASDNLLLSFDHCDVYDGGQICHGGGYALVDAVKGTFEDDVYDPNGSRRPTPKRRLSPAQLQAIKVLADHPLRRMYGFHVMNHGYCDLEGVFKRVAEAAGCVRIDRVTPNFFASDDFQTELADWNIWSPPYTRKRVPAGYYPDATGTTRVWKQYWQVKHEKESWLFEDFGPKHNPNWRYDAACKTVLQITAITWFYREAGDYETRFHIRVISLPYLNPYTKTWGHLKAPFQKYQKMARRVSELMLHRMKAAPPDPLSVRNRSDILRKLKIDADRRRAEKLGLAGAPAAKTISSGADLVTALKAKPGYVMAKVTLPARRRG